METKSRMHGDTKRRIHEDPNGDYSRFHGDPNGGSDKMNKNKVISDRISVR